VNDSQLDRASLPGSGAVQALSWCFGNYLVAYRWSPDGQTLTYVMEPSSWLSSAGVAFDWHLVSNRVDRVIGTAPPWCHCGNGSEDFSADVGFSPDGQFVWLVDYLGIGTNLQVRRLDGSLVGTEIREDRTPANPLTMGVWEGADLLYRDSQGVQRWHDGTTRLFLPGVQWLHPRSSPASGQIVYAARGGDGLARINVVDTSTGRFRQLSGHAANVPVFLTPRYIWYRGERLCGPNEPGICVRATFTGKTYIYDLQTDIESESIITDVADVWPHGA
jgi:hypothetical protein